MRVVGFSIAIIPLLFIAKPYYSKAVTTASYFPQSGKWRACGIPYAIPNYFVNLSYDTH
jgi:hypothetical protein